jgi:hypothetical protein
MEEMRKNVIKYRKVFFYFIFSQDKIKSMPLQSNGKNGARKSVRKVDKKNSPSEHFIVD